MNASSGGHWEAGISLGMASCHVCGFRFHDMKWAARIYRYCQAILMLGNQWNGQETWTDLSGREIAARWCCYAGILLFFELF
jgi:hypothetical protein